MRRTRFEYAPRARIVNANSYGWSERSCASALLATATSRSATSGGIFPRCSARCTLRMNASSIVVTRFSFPDWRRAVSFCATSTRWRAFRIFAS